MAKLLMLVSQKQNFEQDLILIKVHISPIEKNIKYHSSVFMNIMGNTVIMGVMTVHINWTMWNIRAGEREGNILAT